MAMTIKAIYTIPKIKYAFLITTNTSDDDVSKFLSSTHNQRLESIYDAFKTPYEEGFDSCKKWTIIMLTENQFIQFIHNSMYIVDQDDQPDKQKKIVETLDLLVFRLSVDQIHSTPLSPKKTFLCLIPDEDLINVFI